ncbi:MULTISPECIES: hypothetical protein [Salinibaculum]|uniref:hypothetical protein n=1 Tax=Salinibaculum TaxID=2732368 RepID=UPI0030D31A28
MPSRTRRGFLASLGTAGLAGVAGCTAFGSDDIPAGSLQFVNEDVLSHEFTMQVVAVGTEYDRDAREVVGDPAVSRVIAERRTTAVLDANTTRTYEDVFSEPVWYTVQFTFDGEVPENGGQVSFHPAPEDDGRGTYLGAKVFEYGEVTWVVSATDNAGPFDQ